MQDIAQTLGVSANTVSKALNGKAKVSEALREKILKTAAYMGYEKNANASSLSKKSIRLGVLINGYDENYYQYTLKGLEKARANLSDSKVELCIRVVPVDDRTQALSQDVLREFREQAFDGVILTDFLSPSLAGEVKKLKDAGIRTALLNYDFPGNERDFAVLNDYACAAGLAADVLHLCLPDPESPLAVFCHSQGHSGQSALQKEFTLCAKRLGYKNITTVTEQDALFDLLQQKKVDGIYVTHASYLAVCEYVESHFAPQNRPALVVSDLYEKSVPYLQNGTVTAVIYQEPEQQAYRSAFALYRLICKNTIPEEEDLRINPLVVLKSNYRHYL